LPAAGYGCEGEDAESSLTDMSQTATPDSGARPRPGAPVTRIAACVDPYPEGTDAVVLGAALAEATGAELMLVAVHPDLPIVLPPGLNRERVRGRTQAMLTDARDKLAPNARTVLETDMSVPRALRRVVSREHGNLLVVGSSRHGAHGRVRVANRTRQLIHDLQCALAIAPRGLSERSPLRFHRIGVGYDGGPESEGALALAGAIASSCGAELYLCGVIDDRIPALGWPEVWLGDIMADWEANVRAEMESLRERATVASQALDVSVQVDIQQGRPAKSLLALSVGVDLLVVGSRRWGPVARLLLGSTGEALLHDAHCPTLIVPRPDEASAA
jgi:nucleotide-binding universal stress UspA family protein